MSRTDVAVATEDLATITRWLAEQTGLVFDGSHAARMADTIERAYQDSGVASPDDYIELLQHDPGAYGTLTDRLTIGETYFFREPRHFELLRSRIGPEHSTLHRRPLRVWSAGCASGEEPYSVAITLAEAGMADGATIVGTDLSERALERARQAVYGDWSLRRCGDDERRAWFRPHGRRFHLRAEYRDAVRWDARGLLDGPPAGGFDVVLCRNVLIYLSPSAVREAAEVFHAALAPGGWLLMGASDPPLEHPGLELRIGAHGIAYRRVDRHRGHALDAPAPVATASPPPPTPAPVRRHPTRERPAHPATPSRASSEPAEDGGGPLDARLRYRAAVAHLEAGDVGGAAREASAARYLDSGLLAAHLLLAHLADLDGDAAAAARGYRAAVALLTELPGHVIVELVDEPASNVLDGVLRQLTRLEDGP